MHYKQNPLYKQRKVLFSGVENNYGNFFDAYCDAYNDIPDAKFCAICKLYVPRKILINLCKKCIEIFPHNRYKNIYIDFLEPYNVGCIDELVVIGCIPRFLEGVTIKNFKDFKKYYEPGTFLILNKNIYPHYSKFPNIAISANNLDFHSDLYRFLAINKTRF